MSDNSAEIKSPAENEADLDESGVVNLVDFLEEQEELEEESAAILGGSDEKCCTYSKGYIKRQALYSCLTCCPESKTDCTKRAGICLACFYHCHEGHELVELYTKRNFRCDCSTTKISGTKCTFSDVKDDISGTKNEPNVENAYNHNFSGVYCICKRPYPDTEDQIDDDMIQCIICEDWYHTRHLDAFIPKPESYSEMICGSCISLYDFLKDYACFAVNKIDSTNECLEVTVTEDDDKLKSELEKSISDIMNISQCSSPDETDEPISKKPRIDGTSQACSRPKGITNGYKKGGIFLPQNWRKSLCTCAICLKMYDELKITFLLDHEDTVQFYEQNGLKRLESVYESGIEALSSMNRVQQIDVITGYNRLKDKLIEFLHPFVASKKVVTEEDINNFFRNMKNEKKAYVGIPHSCR